MAEERPVSRERAVQNERTEKTERAVIQESTVKPERQKNGVRPPILNRTHFFSANQHYRHSV